MFFRLLIFIFLIFWAVKLLSTLLHSGKPPSEVRGDSQSKPLDLSNEDIEDVDFKETED